MTDRYTEDAEFLRRMATHSQLDWLIPDRERVLRIANVLAAVPEAIDEALDSLEGKLAQAYALIRWCYHDDEMMPANYAEIIAAAKATSIAGRAANPYQRDESWWFHDETGDEYGPYRSKALAESRLWGYVDHLENGPLPAEVNTEVKE